jgi:hypothetical protein
MLRACFQAAIRAARRDIRFLITHYRASLYCALRSALPSWATLPTIRPCRFKWGVSQPMTTRLPVPCDERNKTKECRNSVTVLSQSGIFTLCASAGSTRGERTSLVLDLVFQSGTTRR